MARYITDLSSGFVYENLETFVCNAAATSVPCVWSIRGFPHFESISRFETMTIDSLFQSPPEGIAKSTLRMCSHEAEASCPENSAYFSETLKQKCQSFRSELAVLRPRHTTTTKYRNFHNRYCFYCIKGPDREAMLVDLDVKIDSSLGSLLSIDNHNNVRVAAMSPLFDPWLTAMCDPEQEFKCRATKCNVDFVLRPDGNCKQLMTIHLAMKMPATNLTTKESKNLIRLMQCVMEKDNMFDLYEDHLQPYLEVYSYEGKVTLFGTRFSFYSPYTFDNKDIMAPVALKYGNTLARIINNHREDAPADEVNDGGYLYFFMRWNQTEDGTEEKHHTVVHRPNDKAAPGPFCLSMVRREERGARLYCFPEKENSTTWKVRVEQIEKFDCYRKYINDDWAGGSAGQALWSSHPIGLVICLINVVIQMTPVVKFCVW